jgi:thiol-disulfide isomerase/thioredoxin
MEVSMRPLGCWTAALLVAVGLCLPAGVSAGQKKKSQVGQRAPDLKGDFGINGRPIRLADLKGKVVLLEFWATWSGPCISTFPHLQAWQKEYAEDGLEVLVVTSYFERGFDTVQGKTVAVTGLSIKDERTALENLATFYRVGFRVMTLPKDAWKVALRDYGVKNIPTTILIDRDGIVRMERVGCDEHCMEALRKEIRVLLKKDVP